MIDPEKIRALLASHGCNLRVDARATTESTNDDAKEAALAGMASPALFIADEQTRGRGRSGNAWLAARGESVLLSILLRPDLTPADSANVTLAVGVAVSDVVERYAPGRVRVKWPNDVLLDDKKLAGILVEAQTRGERLSSLVVGLGVNVHATQFSPELDSIATSFAIAGLEPRDRGELAASFTLAIVEAVSRFCRDGLAGFLEVLRARDALLGAEVEVLGVRGTATGIDDKGRLLVRDTSGHDVAIASGHVIRLPPIARGIRQ